VLIASGCSIKQVQMALGHDSARITLDTYARLIPGDENRVHNRNPGNHRRRHDSPSIVAHR
jgi:integrase